jgi:AcrR family transcriptional regulator
MPYPAKTDRGRILAAALRQVEQQGLRGLSLRALAGSLELTPNALYRYFADRAVLEAALVGEVAQLLRSTMERAVRKGGPEQAIRNIARVYLEFARKRPRLYELLLLPCDVHEGKATPHQDLWNFVLEYVTALTGPNQASEATIAFWAYLHGTAQLEALNVFNGKKPGKAFDFGLNAWMAAASANVD